MPTTVPATMCQRVVSARQPGDEVVPAATAALQYAEAQQHRAQAGRGHQHPHGARRSQVEFPPDPSIPNLIIRKIGKVQNNIPSGL